jgi:CRISPR type III-B/RAMP module RAMP protein Cmr1
MSRTQKHTNLKHYNTISNLSDPKGTCCVCDGRKVYTTKSACESLVDSHFAEGQYPSKNMHPCYGHSMNPTETGLCLYSNKTRADAELNQSFSCTNITVGGTRGDNIINYCDFETIFGSSERKSDYEFRFIPLPDFAMCGLQNGNNIPSEFINRNFAKESVKLRRIQVFDTVKQQAPIKRPVHRNPGTIIPITKNKIDKTKVLQITVKKDSKNRKVLKIKTRLDALGAISTPEKVD